MLRFRPDVVHIASPATLGYQAAKAAAELGIPAVAIYQTDLVGFAERYDVPGGVRAMAALTREIHTERRPHAGAVVGEPAPARGARRSRAPRCGRAGSTCRPSIPATARRYAAARSWPATAGSSSATSAGSPRRRSSGCWPAVADDPRYALVVVGGGPEEQRLRTLLPGARFLGVLHGDELGARLRLARRLRAHRAPRDLLPVRPGGARVRSAGRAPRAPAARSTSSTTAWPGSSTEPGDGADLAAYVDKLAADPLLRRRMGLAARRSVAGRSWAVGERAAGRALPRGGRRGGSRAVGWPVDAARRSRAAASSSVSTRCTWPSIARPRAEALQQRPGGRVSVQYSSPTSTIGATEDSSA